MGVFAEWDPRNGQPTLRPKNTGTMPEVVIAIAEVQPGAPLMEPMLM